MSSSQAIVTYGKFSVYLKKCTTMQDFACKMTPPAPNPHTAVIPTVHGHGVGGGAGIPNAVPAMGEQSQLYAAVPPGYR